MTCSLSSQVKWALPSPLDNAASHDNSSLDCKALLDMTNKRTMFNITDQPPSLQWPSSLSLRYILHQMLWKSNKFYPEVRRGALVSFVCSATNATAEHDGGESSHSFHHFAFQMEVAWRAGTLLSPPRVKCVCSPQWYVTKLSSFDLTLLWTRWPCLLNLSGEKMCEKFLFNIWTFNVGLHSGNSWECPWLRRGSRIG